MAPATSKQMALKTLVFMATTTSCSVAFQTCGAYVPALSKLSLLQGGTRMAPLWVQSSAATTPDSDSFPDPPIAWLPALNSDSIMEEAGRDGEIYPLFPLGQNAYLPGTEHSLNIFEPRYRQLYSDIMESGRKKFAVTMVDPETGRFAEAAVLFHLEDLKEVSQQTMDQVKFICSHKVVDRVRIRRVLNPKAWDDQSTYLRVEVDPIKDEDESNEYPSEEADLCNGFDSIVNLQSANQEEPRFSTSLRGAFATGGKLSDERVWTMASLIQTLSNERVRVKAQLGSKTVEKKVMDFITKNGTVEPNEGVQDIPDYLRREIMLMTQSIQREVDGMMGTFSMPFQQLIQSGSKRERIGIMKRMLADEERRLRASASLRTVFGSK